MFQTTTVLTLLCLALTGCVGPTEPARAESGLVEVAPGTAPLDPVEGDDWEDAPECEDRLEGMIQFAIAGDGRIAAVDSQGDVLCVDSVEDVQDELDQHGRSADADGLGDAYLVTIGYGYVPDASDIAAGDPSPQPSLPSADPSPQPSMQ